MQWIRSQEMANKNNARLPDYQSLIAAGIDPKTGLPLKVVGQLSTGKKEDIRRCLRILDEQDAVNRYKWYNLPCSLSSQELERLLYYKGQLAFFYLKNADEFFFMPYALDGGIDFYGRFNSIHPVPFAEGTSDEEKKRFAEQRNYLSTLKLKCQYDVMLDQPDEETMLGTCVLLHDYTKQLAQTITPRQQLQDGLIDIMSDMVPFMRTALLNSTGVQGMRVSTEDEESNVEAASRSVNSAALDGRKYIAVVGGIDFQDLSGGEVAKAEEFLLAMQGLDNLRLSWYGLENGGIFEKKAHVLQDEQNMNACNSALVLQDGLAIRQRFCDIVNSIWDLGIWCDISESAAGVDMNGDGMAYDEQDQSGQMQGEQSPEAAYVE